MSDKTTVSKLIPDSNNANRGTVRGSKMIEDSLQRDGFGRSVLVDKNGKLIAGNKTIEGVTNVFGVDAEVILVKTRGAQVVAVQREDLDLDDPDPNNPARRLAYVDNLAHEFSFEFNPDVIMADMEAGFDFEALDIKMEDWGELLDGGKPESADNAGVDTVPQIDRAEELRVKWGVEPGQLWALGEHRLICGDCTDPAVVERVLQGDVPLLMVTDPPYGVKYDPNWRNEAAEKGFLSYAERRIGIVYNDDRIDWSDAYKLFPGDVAYTWSPGGDPVILTGLAMQNSGFEIRNQIMWRKPHFPISRGHYTYQHEPCWYGVRNGKKSHWIGDNAASTVWEIALDKNVDGGHSTQKPLECMARPIRNHEGDVYEPFCGSGTTIIATENLKRRCYACEIDPGYVAVALQRYADHTGREPQLITN